MVDDSILRLGPAIRLRELTDKGVQVAMRIDSQVFLVEIKKAMEEFVALARAAKILLEDHSAFDQDAFDVLLRKIEDRLNLVEALL